MDEATNEHTTTPSQTPQSETPTPQQDTNVAADEEKLQEAVEARAKKILNRKEEIIWRGTPHQFTIGGSYALTVLLIIIISYLSIKFSVYLFALLVIPIGFIGYKLLRLKTTIFEITNKRLKMKSGIFNIVTNEIELYDIKNTVLQEKRSNKGHITFYTKNEKFDKIKFPRMNNPAEIHDKVRDIYEEIKLERNKITHTKK
jgi:hypothetical protein